MQRVELFSAGWEVAPGQDPGPESPPLCHSPYCPLGRVPSPLRAQGPLPHVRETDWEERAHGSDCERKHMHCLQILSHRPRSEESFTPRPG